MQCDSLPEGPTFVLMRNRTHRFSSGQNTFLYWRFTPCSFLILLCEKVTAQTVSILPHSSQKDRETTSSGWHLHTLQPPMSRDFRKGEGKLLTCVAIIGLLSRQVAHPTRCKQASKVRSWDRFVHTGAVAEGFCSIRWCVQITPHNAK